MYPIGNRKGNIIAPNDWTAGVSASADIARNIIAQHKRTQPFTSRCIYIYIYICVYIYIVKDIERVLLKFVHKEEDITSSSSQNFAAFLR